MANSSLIDALQNAAADFIAFYKDSPSYKEAVYRLRQALEEVDLVSMSPGRQAARDAVFQPTGQEPSPNPEPPMEAQN
jgi:hypothetical protein